MKTVLIIFITICSLAQNAISADEKSADPDSCDAINGSDAYRIDDNNSLHVVYDSNESKNFEIYIYLKTHGNCRVVLSTEGSVVHFIKNATSKFPDVDALWHISADKNVSTYYIWDGIRYISRQVGDSEKLNKAALAYFKKGDIDQAINIWEKAKDLAIIPGLGFTSNAEVLNNLGYAYHKLAKKTKAVPHYRSALHYLDAATQVNYRRWETYLNLGDLYMDMSNEVAALKNYQKLLELNPSYKHANKINDSIAAIQGRIKSSAVILKEIETQVHARLPSVKFKLVQDKNCARLEISSNKIEELNQQFDCFESAGDFDIIDINFDGYKDIMVLSFVSANLGYSYWLFDPKRNKYTLIKEPNSDEDEILWNPSIDVKSKTLTTRWSGSDHSSTKVYSYEKGERDLLKEDSVNYRNR